MIFLWLLLVDKAMGEIYYSRFNYGRCLLKKGLFNG